MVASQDLELHQLDMKTTVLKGDWRRTSTCSSQEAKQKRLIP